MTTESSRLLREASVLKLRGVRQRALAGGGTDWSAVAPFHAAARIHLELLVALYKRDGDPQTIVGHATEACGLFLDARDPVRAAWCGAIITQAEQRFGPYPPGSTLAGTAKHENETFQLALRSVLARLPSENSFAGVSERMLRPLLVRYMGVSGVWFGLYRAGEAEGDWDLAVDGIEHAEELNPKDDRLSALWFYAAPRAVGMAMLDNAGERVERHARSPNVHLMYATALLEVSRVLSSRAGFVTDAHAQLVRAFQVAPAEWGLKRTAKALRVYVESLLHAQHEAPNFEMLMREAGVRASQPVTTEERFLATIGQAASASFQVPLAA